MANPEREYKIFYDDLGINIERVGANKMLYPSRLQKRKRKKDKTFWL
jgi:hypothetical protein